MRILNVEPEGYAVEAREILLKLGELHEEACDREMLLARVALADVLIVRLGHRIDAAVLERAPNLRIIVSATTGLNHIDLDATASRGITVLCLRGQRAFLDSVTATAELTWGLLIALVRKLVPAAQSVESGVWDRDLFRGLQLSGKTIGIVGMGRLGRIVAEYAQAFRMNVLYADPFVEDVSEAVTRVELPELLARSDVVSIHVAFSEETRKLFDAKAFARMKPGAVLINTARGEIIDEAALLEALESERIAGAAIDVLDDETGLLNFADHPLIRFAAQSDRLVVTPHIGGATHDSLRDAETYMARMLERYLSEMDA